MMIRSSVAVLLLFLAVLSSIVRPSTCLDRPCEDLPSHVSSLVSLEQAILCDEYNIQSLTESFFPANRRQAIIVLVNYYINTTQHPLALPPGEKDNSTVLEPDYVFFWFSSSVLVFIEPRFLEGLALRTYVAQYNYAHIRINAPFLYNDSYWITGMLSNATIWLKSYAERRLISITEGMTLELQGFSAYKPNIHRDDYFVHNASTFNGLYVVFLGLSFSLIVSFICVASPILILKYYKAISKLSMSDKHGDHVSFKFHNLFWGLVVSLGLGLIAIYSFSIWNILTFGLKWDTDYFFIYPFLIAGMILIFILGVIEAFIVVHKINAANTLILLPSLLLRIVGVSSQSHDGITPTNNSIPVRGSAQRIVTIVWQFIGVFIVQNMIVFMSFFSCGILMAIFIDSVQVITTFAIYTSILLCLTHGFAALFEATDNAEQSAAASATHIGTPSASKHILSTRFGLYLKYFLIVVGIVLMTLFITLFGFSFAYIVFFAGTSDESAELFSSTGELLPVALASAIGWLLRREFKSYDVNANDGNDMNTTAADEHQMLSLQPIPSSRRRNSSKMPSELETDFNTIHVNQQQHNDIEQQSNLRE